MNIPVPPELCATKSAVAPIHIVVSLLAVIEKKRNYELGNNSKVYCRQLSFDK